MARETILEDVAEGVAVLTMHRPERRNAFDTQMYDELAAALGDAAADDAVRAVVVTGAGSAFSAGQDLAEMGRLATAGPGDGATHGFGRFMDTLVAFDKPLLAAVNGVGVGLGFTMLLHCDLVYLADTARLRLPFVPLGVVPEAASSYLLPLAVGHQHAADLVYTGGWLEAPRAVEIGLAIAVCPADTVLATTRAKAAEIATGPLEALRASKRVMMAARIDAIRAARRREDAAFAAAIGSSENLGAIERFLDTGEL